MPEQELQKIADNAKIIVNGYAFSKRDDGFISILNLEHPDCAIVINQELEIIETNMDEIEQEITTIQKFIKANYLDMYKTWKDFGGGNFYNK